MKKLTAEQEDIVLENEIEERKEKQEEPMRNWIKDHLEDLSDEFVEIHTDEFNIYCKNQFMNMERGD